MACTHLCRGGRIDRLIALARSFVAVNKTPPVMLRTKKLVSYLHHQFSNSAQCPRDRSRPEVGHGPSQTCPMSVSHDVPLPSLAPLSPPPPFFVSVLDPPGFFFAPGPGPGPALTIAAYPARNNQTKQSGVLAVIYLFLTSVNLLLPLLLAVLFSYLTCTFSGFPYKSEAARLRMRKVRGRKGGRERGGGREGGYSSCLPWPFGGGRLWNCGWSNAARSGCPVSFLLYKGNPRGWCLYCTGTIQPAQAACRGGVS